MAGDGRVGAVPLLSSWALTSVALVAKAPRVEKVFDELRVGTEPAAKGTK